MTFSAGEKSAHFDDFVLRNLPDRASWPVFDFSKVPTPEPYPGQLNCAEILLREAFAAGYGERPALCGSDFCWSYDFLDRRVNAIANYLVNGLGLVPGNRVLLRAWNGPMLAACWLAVAKAGGVNVTTVAMLRAGELTHIINKAQISHALVQDELQDELHAARQTTACLKEVAAFSFEGNSDATLDRALLPTGGTFVPVVTASDDPVMIGFTSGTTGFPKAAVHFHRSVLAATDCFPRDMCPFNTESVIAGSPPLAFTFGLGALLAIPLRFGASAIMTPHPSPENLLSAVARHGVTDLFTVPTMYRAMMDQVDNYDLSSLRRCMSAGEALPADTLDRWRERTGLDIHDGIGSTEMLHHFLATPPGEAKHNITGRPIQGFSAKIVDDDGAPVETGETGRLTVRGPTGCLYLNDPERQKVYVQDGWNITGDLFRQDNNGDFQFVSRADDMIVSAGYNISGIEVEDAVLRHPRVSECAVIGAEDDQRGEVVCALVVLRNLDKPDEASAEQALTQEIQDFVKDQIAPYKYPRLVRFVSELPKTATGKIQRYQLRQTLKITTPEEKT